MVERYWSIHDKNYIQRRLTSRDIVRTRIQWRWCGLLDSGHGIRRGGRMDESNVSVSGQPYRTVSLDSNKRLSSQFVALPFENL